MGKLSDGKRWDCVAGLAGSRYQSLVVRELEQQMAMPDTAITSDYLFILGKLKFQIEHEAMPPYPDRDEQQQKVWRERMKAQNEELGRLQDALYQRTATLLSTKRGLARAQTVRTLLFRPVREPEENKPLTGLPEAEVANAFLALSADEQWSMLDTFWKRVKVPAMVGPLEKILEQPNLQNQMLRDVALRRVYELDPSRGTERIREEIKHPHFLDNGMTAVKPETLGVLPSETLPAFDQLLAERLEGEDRRSKDLDAQLVGRYATKAVLSRVKAVYESDPGWQDCATADCLVTYLKVEPDYGVRRLAQKPTNCMPNALAAVVRMRRWSEVEPGIIARLNDSDLNCARSAAEILAKYGSPQAEKAMWERLRRFHKQWAEHASQLNSRPQMPREALDAMGFQFGLVEALGRAQAWILTNEQITELENLTLGSEQENVKHWHWRSPIDLTINFLFDERLQADVNHQYLAADAAALVSKLAQYPSGTTFRLTTFGPPELLAPVLREVDEAAADNGLIVESSTPR